MAGPTGLTTEQFIDKVAWRLGRYVAAVEEEVTPEQMVIPESRHHAAIPVDNNALQELFDGFDVNRTGKIGVNELGQILTKLNVAPQSFESIMQLNNKKKVKEDSKEDERH